MSACTVTIYYLYADGTLAADTYKNMFEYGENFNINSPVIHGYVPDVPSVAGIATDDVQYKVTYAAVPLRATEQTVSVEDYEKSKQVFSFMKAIANMTLKNYIREAYYDEGSPKPGATDIIMNGSFDDIKNFLRQNVAKINWANQASVIALNNTGELQNYIKAIKESAAKNGFNTIFMRDSESDTVISIFPNSFEKELARDIKDFEIPKTTKTTFTEEDVTRAGTNGSYVMWMPLSSSPTEIESYIHTAAMYKVPVCLSLDDDGCRMGYNSSSQEQFNKVIRTVAMLKALKENYMETASDYLMKDVYYRAQNLNNENQFNIILGTTGGIINVKNISPGKTDFTFTSPDGAVQEYHDIKSKESATAFVEICNRNMPCIVSDEIPASPQSRINLVQDKIRQVGISDSLPLSDSEKMTVASVLSAYTDTGKIPTPNVDFRDFSGTRKENDPTLMANCVLFNKIDPDIINSLVNEINAYASNTINVIEQGGITIIPDALEQIVHKVNEIEGGDTVR